MPALKLGSETASIHNYLMSGTLGQPTPAVGMGCTILMWTDRHAATITRVSPSGKSFHIVEDKAVRTDSNGMSENQEYSYSPGSEKEEKIVRLTKRGWKCSTGRVALGYRSEYRDFGF